MTHRTNHGELGCSFSNIGQIFPYVGGIEFDFFVTREGKEYQFVCRNKEVLEKIKDLQKGQLFTIFYKICQDKEGETYMMCKYIMTDDKLQKTLDFDK